VDPDSVPRMATAQAHSMVQSGEAIFACAYEDPAKYEKLKLEGSVSLQDLQARLPSLPKNQPIILYCA